MDQYTFTTHVHACLAKAATMFNLPRLNSDVNITFNAVGRSAGWARDTHDGQLFLEFNPEAIALDVKYAIETVIPHEVAHLVCYINPSLGKKHDDGWKRVCLMLGGDGKRTTHLELTPAKNRAIVRYIYRVKPGVDITVTRQTHKFLQHRNPIAGLEVTVKRTRETHVIKKIMFVGEKVWHRNEDGKHVIAGAPVIPADLNNCSKIAGCMAILRSNPTITRGMAIDLFIEHVGMTKAGASTYYQQAKSKLEWLAEIQATFE